MVGVVVAVSIPGVSVVVVVIVVIPTFRGGKTRKTKTDSLNDDHES